MYYYLVSLSKINSEPFTYESEVEIPLFSKVKVPFQNREKEGYIVEEIEKPSYKCLPIKEKLDLFLTKEQFQIATFISAYYFSALSLALDLFYPFSDSEELEPISIKTSVELSKKQNNSLKFLDQNKIALLFGDTGSGKTEIYIKAIEKTLNNNQTAIFLMPEISLTPQIEKRLKEHFQDTIAIWHSKITKKKKEKILEDISSGKVRIVAGARSALFLPMKNLGLIIVDEEHDESYKSSTAPKYQARDLAILFGDRLGIQVILGSATPSMKSYKNLPTTRLKGQYFKGSKEFIFKNPTEHIFDYETLQLLKKSVENKKQAIVFVPTRANFKYLVCRTCGYTVQCPFCNVAMSTHTHGGILKCHYCGYTQKIISQCPECGNGELESNRVGTAEVVNFIKSHIDCTVEQFDRDIITTDKKLKDVLNRFNSNEIDILVGTQMLSKGHNYHNVEMCIILGLDYMLATADYKADEKALSMLYQIAGRAGRAGEAQIVVETNNESFFASYLGDYEIFLKDNLPFRENLYPPFVKMAKILFEDPNPSKIEKSLADTLKTLQSFKSKVEIIGHGECPISKINKNYRHQIILRSHTSKDLLQALANCTNQLCKIDVDPISFT